MQILVGCEVSGLVRDAFTARGHMAVSCDIDPSETPGPHLQADVLSILDCGWDMLIAFPPCTHLCSSGARWFAEKKVQQQMALDFVFCLMAAPIPKIAIENPVGVISTKLRKPDQIIQPWQFGHSETKTTCLWLQNLPLLKPTSIVANRTSLVHRMPPGKNRAKRRSRTFDGIADAMAQQWGVE